MGERDEVPVLLAEHRARVWEDRHRRHWSWDDGRQMWLEEERGESDRDAWHTAEELARFPGRGPFRNVGPS